MAEAGLLGCSQRGSHQYMLKLGFVNSDLGLKAITLLSCLTFLCEVALKYQNKNKIKRKNLFRIHYKLDMSRLNKKNKKSSTCLFTYGG